VNRSSRWFAGGIASIPPNTFASPADLSYQAMETDMIAKSLVANTRAATGVFANEYIIPGTSYSSGQWLWDSAFEAVAAANVGLGTRAQGWLRNWITIQNSGTGFIPNNTTTSTPELRFSGPPVLAWAVYNVYLKTLDTAFLTAMQPCLKLFYAWWEANRQDANALFSWGSSQTGSPTQGQVEQNARYESGQDLHPMFVDGLYAHGNGNTIDHICPDLCSMLVMEADSISKIATVLGATSDATTYATKRDALKLAMNNLCWDDDQGCYQPVARADLAVSLGTTAAISAGAASFTLNSALTIPLVQGMKLLFANGVYAQVGFGGAAVGATSVPIQTTGLSFGAGSAIGAVSASTAVTMLPLLYVKTLTAAALPMWAGVPTAARARRIHDEHLMKTFTGGEVDSCTIFLGSAYDSATNRMLKFKHLAWHVASLAAVGGQIVVNADSLEHVTGGAATLFSYNARNMAATADRPYADMRLDEAKTSPSRPVTVTTTWVQPAAGSNKPQVTLNRYPENDAILNAVLTSGASVGAVTSAALSYAGTARPFGGSVLQQSGNNANVKVQSLQIDSYPVGSPYLTPFGLVYTGRFSDYALAADESAVAGDVTDYWKGDHWLNIEYLAVLGLLNYGMGQSARDVADRVVRRVHGEWVRTGNFWERYGMRGAGKGSVNYGWTGLVSSLVRLFHLPGARASLS